MGRRQSARRIETASQHAPLTQPLRIIFRIEAEVDITDAAIWYHNKEVARPLIRSGNVEGAARAAGEAAGEGAGAGAVVAGKAVIISDVLNLPGRSPLHDTREGRSRR